MKRVITIFGYCRVSTDHQTDQNQRMAILKYLQCAAQGLDGDRWVEVTMSSRRNPHQRRIDEIMDVPQIIAAVKHLKGKLIDDPWRHSGQEHATFDGQSGRERAIKNVILKRSELKARTNRVKDLKTELKQIDKQIENLLDKVALGHLKAKIAKMRMGYLRIQVQNY